MEREPSRAARVFKTKWFAKSARKARIAEEELCDAIHEAMLGQADDLGGGVFKKRLNRNLDRSIILAKSGERWVFEYLFSKKNRANIDSKEPQAFRALAKIYDTYTQAQVNSLIHDQDWLEICHEDPK